MSQNETSSPEHRDKTVPSAQAPLDNLGSSSGGAPREFKVWAFAHLWRVSELPGLRQVKALISLMFVELAPAVPVSLKRSMTGTAGLQAAVLGALITLLFCFVVPVVWTLAVGRFWGDQPAALLGDRTNLFLYSVVCPLYVGLGCWLMVTAIRGWSEVNDYALELETSAARASRAPMVKRVFLVVLIFSMGLFSTSAYIRDIMNPENVSQLYWFMDLTPTGDRTLGPLGVYYFLINFVLLMITLTSITLFMSMFVSAIDVGRSLATKSHPSDAGFAVLKAKLSAFTEAYILAKGLTFVYMVNFILWKRSPLGETQNIYVALIFLTLFGVLFVSLPRYFVELQWYRYLVRSGQAGDGDVVEHDIRPFKTYVLASILDVVLISGFVFGMAKELVTGEF